MSRARALFIVALAIACVPRSRSASEGNVRWVGSWEAPPQLTEPRNLPPAPGLSAATLRQVIHLSAGGSRLRVRFSNEFGTSPFSIALAHVARSRGGDSIDSAGDTPVLFRGEASVTIPPGEAVVSDVADCSCAPLSEITVSVYVAQMPVDVTGHPGSRTTSYLAPGNHVSAANLPQAIKTEHWYILTSVDVLSRAQSAAVVILGNSIADGRGSGTDRNNRWPDNLARRLQGDPRTAHVAVLNAGIGGNTVLRGGLGPPALARFDRDVLSADRGSLGDRVRGSQRHWRRARGRLVGIRRAPARRRVSGHHRARPREGPARLRRNDAAFSRIPVRQPGARGGAAGR